MSFATYTCPSCKATIQLDNSKTYGFCSACGVKLTFVTKKSDNSENEKLIANYMQLAKNAEAGNNFQSCISYCDKILEISPSNSAAWALKASAAGWSSTLQTIRISEMIQYYSKAISCEKDDSIRSKIQEQAKDNFLKISRAIWKKELQWFEERAKPSTFDDVCQYYYLFNNLFEEFTTKICIFELEEFFDYLIPDRINACCTAYDKLADDYNKYHSLEDFSDGCDAVAGIIGMAALGASPMKQVKCYELYLFIKNNKLKAYTNVVKSYGRGYDYLESIKQDIRNIEAKKRAAEQKALNGK